MKTTNDCAGCARCGCDEGIVAYHGTSRCGFGRFDMAKAGAYNIGLHFGTRAAAESRIEYLREQNPAAKCRILACELRITNPFRAEDVFGHSYIGILTALQEEIERSTPEGSPLRGMIIALIDEYMMTDDDPVLSRQGRAYLAYCRRLNSDVIRLFQALGYDGIVYRNELEDGESAADSYCIFDVSQVSVVGEEKATKERRSRRAA